MMQSFVEIGLSFLEGFALIVSPCILPVLPLVLTTSLAGGRRRPFGIILGFVLAFSAFTLLARWVVGALGVDLDIVQNVSLVLLAFFGIVLLVPSLSGIFSAATQNAADWSNRLAGQRAQGGFFSGLLIGALIGLVWTPCAGPVLAAVLVQVIRQGTDANAAILLLAFAFGAGAPMLLIALLGRKIMDKLGFFKRHAQGVRRAFGVLILLAVAFIAFGAGAQQAFSAGEPSMAARQSKEQGLDHALSSPYPAPEFVSIDPWMNTDHPLKIAELKGKVVLVDFWTYSCINCLRTLPFITAWDKKYRDKGLVIVGVHAPEFAFERKPDNVRMAIEKYHIAYPVALDNALATWSAYANHYWPAHYLIDREGRVVYTHFGEGAYDVTEHNIRYLLGLSGPEGVEEPQTETPFRSGQTPETYLGTLRADHYVGAHALASGAQGDLAFPPFLPTDHWGLQGAWDVEGEKVVALKAGAALRLNFTARKVFLVLGTKAGTPIQAKIMLNGEEVGPKAGADAPNGVVQVDHNRLYALIDQGAMQNGLIEIEALAPGLEAYAFTFGE